MSTNNTLYVDVVIIMYIALYQGMVFHRPTDLLFDYAFPNIIIFNSLDTRAKISYFGQYYWLFGFGDIKYASRKHVKRLEATYGQKYAHA